jgi:hypothetical protein
MGVSAKRNTSEPSEAIEDITKRLLRGAIDLHCHSGPSLMPRRLNHLEAIDEASSVGMRAILFKDHLYSVAPVVELLNEAGLNKGMKLLSGVPLNNTTGGLNPYAVQHGLHMGAKLVWMPTFSAANHIRHTHRVNFLTTKKPMMKPTGLTVVSPRGELLDEVKVILDLIAEADCVLSAGHLHISEVWPLFEEAKRRGVKRLLVNHPTAVIDASYADMKELAGMGAYLEHSICMWIDCRFRSQPFEILGELISAGGVDNTILGSDLGQIDNPTPVEGFREVIGLCLKLGVSETDIKKMIEINPSKLIGAGI